MSALKKAEIKLLAADRRKLEKAQALLADVVEARFADKSANQMGAEGLRVWDRLETARQAVGSALRD